MKRQSGSSRAAIGRVVSLLAPLLLLASGAGGAATGAESSRVESFRLLQALVETPGVSGHEGAVRERIRSLLPDWAREDSRVDAKGNLLVAVGGRGGKGILFVAHMDETGYVIKSLEKDGTARVQSRGGFFNYLYEGHVVQIHARGGTVAGVVRPRGTYLSGAGESRDFPDEEVILDFGSESRAETEALGVAPGDSVTVPKKFRRLAGRMGAGRAVDDRAGCVALVEALRRLDPTRLLNRVTFAWSVEEEIGLKGAEALATESSFEVVFAVDTFVSSDSPLERKGFALGILGRGPVVRAIDNSNLAPAGLVERVQELAAAHRIPLQVGLTRGGNDGSVFPARGAADVPISWPTVYSHSPVEVIHEEDLGHLGRLVEVLARSW